MKVSFENKEIHKVVNKLNFEKQKLDQTGQKKIYILFQNL